MRNNFEQRYRPGGFSEKKQKYHIFWYRTKSAILKKRGFPFKKFNVVPQWTLNQKTH